MILGSNRADTNFHKVNPVIRYKLKIIYEQNVTALRIIYEQNVTTLFQWMQNTPIGNHLQPWTHILVVIHHAVDMILSNGEHTLYQQLEVML